MNPAGVHLFDDADEYRVHCEKCSKIRNACWRPRDRINSVIYELENIRDNGGDFLMFCLETK